MTSDSESDELQGHYELVTELRKLRLRTFGEIPVSELTRRHPNLARLAEDSAAMPVGGDRVRGMLLSAADKLTPPSLRESAAMLFGLSASTYAKSHSTRRDLARRCFSPIPTESTFRQQPQYLQLILDRLVRVLLAEASGGNEYSAHPGRAGFDGIRRYKLEASVRAALQGQSRPLTLWGEGGNGKTYLARNIAAEIAREFEADLPVAVVRRGNSRNTDEQTYQADLIEALIAAGRAPQSWSLAAQEIEIRNLLSGIRCFSVFVLDDVDQSVIDRLVPAPCSTPVLITSRTRPAGDMPHIRVGAYEDAEALAAIQAILNTSDEPGLHQICRMLGNRPVAINLSARMIDAGYATLDSLISALAEDTPGTLESSHYLVGENVTNSIVRLYAEIHGRIQLRPAAVAVVDILLWLTSGVIAKYTLEGFLAKRVETDAQWVAHTAALSWLTEIGLVQIESGTVELNGLSQALLRWLESGRLDEVVGNWFLLLDETDYWYRPDSSLSAPWYDKLREKDERTATIIKTYSTSYAFSRWILGELLFDGDIAIICMGHRDWLIREKDTGLLLGKSERTRCGVIHIGPSSIVLWTASGRPRALTNTEVILAYRLVSLHQTVMHSEYDVMLDPEVDYGSVAPFVESINRFAWIVSPQDGHGHKRIDAYPDDFNSSSSVSWSLCGRRFNAAIEQLEGPACPECHEFQTSSERLSKLEDLAESILTVVDAGSRLKSDIGAYCLTLRGKIRQLKISLETDPLTRYLVTLSAVQDYIAAFEILAASTEDQKAWQVQTVYGIVENMCSLEPVFKIRILPLCRWLLSSMDSDVAPAADIVYCCSRVLAEFKCYDEAVVGYEKLLAVLNAQNHGGSKISPEKINQESVELAGKIGKNGDGNEISFLPDSAAMSTGAGSTPSCSSMMAGSGSAAHIHVSAEVKIAGIRQEESSGNHLLVLVDEASDKGYSVPCRLLQVDAIRHLMGRAVDKNEYVLPYGLLHAMLTEADVKVISANLSMDGTANLTLSNGKAANINPADAIIIALWFSATILIFPEPCDVPDPGFAISQHSAAPDSDAAATQGSWKSILSELDLSDVRRVELTATGVNVPIKTPFVLMREQFQERWVRFFVAVTELAVIESWQYRSVSFGGYTHDMSCKVLEAAGIRLLSCTIGMSESGLVVIIELSGDKMVTARTGDAIALSLRMGAPISCSKQVLDKWGSRNSKLHGLTMIKPA
jgi:bifunctional DNase/RNase